MGFGGHNIHEILQFRRIHYACHMTARIQSGQSPCKEAGHRPWRRRRPGESVEAAPELLKEAARDLVAICRALNRTSPAAHILQPLPKGKRDVLASAYRAVGEAFELAREVQDDADDFGLDQVNGVALAVLLRRVSRDLQREADAWDQA